MAHKSRYACFKSPWEVPTFRNSQWLLLNQFHEPDLSSVDLLCLSKFFASRISRPLKLTMASGDYSFTDRRPHCPEGKT